MLKISFCTVAWDPLIWISQVNLYWFYYKLASCEIPKNWNMQDQSFGRMSQPSTTKKLKNGVWSVILWHRSFCSILLIAIVWHSCSKGTYFRLFYAKVMLNIEIFTYSHSPEIFLFDNSKAPKKYYASRRFRSKHSAMNFVWIKYIIALRHRILHSSTLPF